MEINHIEHIEPSHIPWKYLQISTKNVVLYHLKILELVAEAEKIFSPLMLTLYLFTLSLICFEVYRATLVSFFFELLNQF